MDMKKIIKKMVKENHTHCDFEIQKMKYIIYSKETLKPVYIVGRNIMITYLENAVYYITHFYPDLYYVVARDFNLERNKPFYLR